MGDVLTRLITSQIDTAPKLEDTDESENLV